jgi:hypothetical protein
MLSHHDWARSMQRLDRIIERCAGTPHTRASAVDNRVLQS